MKSSAVSHVLPGSSTPKGILFDLDGTLVDSAPDIAYSLNNLLESYSYKHLSITEVRSMIGNGLKVLVKRAFDARGEALSNDALECRTEKMMELYRQHLVVDTRPMKGAQTLLEILAKKRLKIAVVTNKPVSPSEEIISYFGWDKYIDIVVGGDSLTTRKPGPEMLLFACDKMNLSVDQCLMIGDSPADIDAAIAANMNSVAIRGGYTNKPVENLGADVVLNDLSECIPLLSQ